MIEVVVIQGIQYDIDMDLDPEMMECRSNNRHDMRVRGVASDYLDNVTTLTGFMYVTRCERCDSYRIQMLDAMLRVIPRTTRYDLSPRYLERNYPSIDPGQAKIWCLGYELIMKRRQSNTHSRKKNLQSHNGGAA